MLLFSLRSAVFPRGGQATGQNCRAGRDPDKMDREKRRGCVHQCVCVCARVNEGRRANIYLVREEKKGVKSDERKTGRKQSQKGGSRGK